MSSPVTDQTPKRSRVVADIDYNALLSAIKDVKINGFKRRTTARAYNIPKTSFIRYLDRLDDEVLDITALTDADLLQMLRRYTHRTPPLLVILFHVIKIDYYVLLFIIYICNVYFLQGIHL